MKPLLDLDAYLFDLDGTVYIGNKLMPGVCDTLTELRQLGKQVSFYQHDGPLTRRSAGTSASIRD
jgi:arabinose operon protein AraL